MAVPAVIGGPAIGGSALRAASRAGMQKLKDLLIQIGLWEAIQAAASDPTAVLSSMYENLTKSGGDVDRLAATGDGGRKIMLIEAARSGVFLDENAGLSRAEALKYAKMFRDFGRELSASADANQVSRPSMDNAALEDASYLLAMSRVCARLSLTGPNRFRQLYEISVIMNSIQEVDVEKAELHESLFGALRA